MTTQEQHNVQLVRDYLDAIVRKDFKGLNLAPVFRHSSPFGVIEGPDAFIEACKLIVAQTQAIEIRRELVQGNTVCVHYEAVTASGRLAMTEWFILIDDLISEIRVFFDARIQPT